MEGGGRKDVGGMVEGAGRQVEEGVHSAVCDKLFTLQCLNVIHFLFRPI